MKDKEIEIKLSIDKYKYDGLKAKFEKQNLKSKFKEQKDVYFTPQNENFFNNKQNDKCLRLREEGDKCFLNYKHIIFGKNELDISIDEFETEIENNNQLEKILEAIGITPVVVVHKLRWTYIYKNDFEIALDEVKNLGYFIEIEVLKDFGNIKLANEALLKIVDQLGLDLKNRNIEGYSNLMYKKINGEG